MELFFEYPRTLLKFEALYISIDITGTLFFENIIFEMHINEADF